MEKIRPNPTQPNTTNNGAYSLAVTYFLYTELIDFRYQSDRPYNQI